MNNHDKRVK